jgi:hypothetical protein
MATVSKPTSQVPQQKKKDDDWTLTTNQMIFMLRYHNPVEAAYTADDMDYLRKLAASDEIRAVFGAMSWDEAFDRYEEMLVKDAELSADFTVSIQAETRRPAPRQLNR